MASPDPGGAIKQWSDLVPIIGGTCGGALLFLGITRFFNWLERRRYGPQGRPTKKGDTRLF